MSADSQAESAEEWYKKGENAYTRGDFEVAAEAFKHGFAVEKDEAKQLNYLYNIAQSYRQAENCKKALFFYRRFIAVTNNIEKRLPEITRKQVADWITELEICVQQTSKP